MTRVYRSEIEFQGIPCALVLMFTETGRFDAFRLDPQITLGGWAEMRLRRTCHIFSRNISACLRSGISAATMAAECPEGTPEKTILSAIALVDANPDGVTQ